MRRRIGAVLRENELRGRVADRLGKGGDRRQPLGAPVHGSYVDRAYALREALHRFRVNLRIALTAVAYEYERKVGVRAEYALDVRELPCALRSLGRKHHAGAEVAQEQ